MTRHSRRDLLRFAALGAAAGSVSSLSPLRAMCGRNLTPITDDKLLVVFLPGAIDALYTVAPVGDPDYATVRQELLTPLGATPYALDNQNFMFLSDLFRELTLPGGALANGHMRFALQVGNPDGKRSHFTEIQIHQCCKQPTGFTLPEDGVMGRLATEAMFYPNLPMGTVGATLQRFFISPSEKAAHIKRIADYNLGHEDGEYEGYPINLNGFDADLRAGMTAHHSLQRVATTNPINPADIALPAASTADFALLSESEVSNVTVNHQATEFPTSQAEGAALNLPTYNPGPDNMRRLEEALSVLEQTDCSVMGVDIGGWDTHSNQASSRAASDPWLAKGLDSLYRRAIAAGPLTNKPLTILVVSEFGRTNNTNAVGPTAGTDHGVGGLVMALGPTVDGSTVVSNGASNWLNIGVDSPVQGWKNALEVKTDWRMIYHELFRKRFNLNATQLAAVLPQTVQPGLDQELGMFL